MTIKLRFLRRLGDICLLLHTAYRLNEQGHEVLIECEPRFADILKCCSYVKYSNPYCPEPADETYNLGIAPEGGGSPERYREFRTSGKTWGEFVIDSVPRLAGTYGPPVFDVLHWFNPRDYDLPKSGRYALVAASGYSQQQKYPEESVIAKARETFGDIDMARLTDKPNATPGYIYVKRLRDMPGLIQHAKYFMGINSAPVIVAAGVREVYHHIVMTLPSAQQDLTLFKGISIPITL